jgi:hypothetical protein
MPPKKSNKINENKDITIEEDQNITTKSKRGRPPIQKTPPVKPKKTVIINNEEELVLHLPVFDEESSDNKNIFTMHDSESSNLTFDEITISEIEKKTDVNNLIEEINKRDVIIKNLKDNLRNFKNISQENILTITKETKKTLVNLGLISLETNKLIMSEKTSIACWHCTYNFDSVPLFLPEKYHNGKFYVFGNFCSWGCMLAYNNQIDEYRKQIRNSLIKKLYKDIYGVECLIKPAGPRECLEKFGGPVKIEKFRDPKLNQTLSSKINIPPQIPLLSYYEETIIDNN